MGCCESKSEPKKIVYYEPLVELEILYPMYDENGEFIEDMDHSLQHVYRNEYPQPLSPVLGVSD